MSSHPFRGMILIALWAVLASMTLAQESQPKEIHVASPSEQVPPLSRSASAQELENEGDTLRGEKQYFAAIDYYQATLSKTPDSPSVLKKLGITELMLLRYKQAEKDFQHAIRERRDFAEAFNNLGAIYYARHKYRASIRQYQRALTLQPDSATFYTNLGAAYFSTKQFDYAMSAYAKAVRLDPAVFEHISHSGVTLQMAAPDDRGHYNYVVAMLYAKIGDRDHSLEFLRKSIEEGYKGVKNVYTDPQFADLRKDARFTVLMNSVPIEIPE